MVKPLSFKGDKPSKKRKHLYPPADPTSPLPSPSLTPNPPPPSSSLVDDDDTWVTADTTSDITGPILITLPSTPPTCLACDPNGQVFASPLENILSDDPSTAEPHDVRQVWVATRITGTENHSLKGHHGRYLSASKPGTLSATREAISPEETFLIIPAPESAPGTFSIQTARDSFLSLSPDSSSIHSSAPTLTFNTTFRIRMQARFKPKLQASKASAARAKISRAELEAAVGRRLEEEEVRRLKRARREGTYHEEVLDVRVKGKHDKFAS
ncbi:hypothetical protein MMC20_003905 [Loxospora ochrophaea]|nr:hypothetical protein [Loxospora ochrophaea]